ncbi:MAG: indolepyruvate oxidoreductase subunit beta [Halobacteriota archaeon]|nr:indolepyruvate oxidoreductase subunit beta [Halobacteriota archaeon]
MTKEGKRDPLNLIICGVGGQGNVLASRIIASAGIEEGLFVTIGETYGASQRGGSVMSHVRFSEVMQYGPLIPEGSAHIILGFEPTETLRVIADFGNPDIDVIVNPRPYYSIDVLAGRSEYPDISEVLDMIRELSSSLEIVEATELAKEAGKALTQSVVMIGALAGSRLLPISEDAFRSAITSAFLNKDPDLNQRAFDLGFGTLNRTL